MSTASKKAQQSSPATTSETGGSKYFRRQKIVPAVVARKLSNNNSTKSASSKESTNNVPPAKDETSDVPQAASETMDLEQPMTPMVETETVVPVDKSIPKVVAVESIAVKKPDVQNNHTASSKPAASAFRRIKPKVVIPQTQKPAKSILKNSMTPVKGSSSCVEKLDCATNSNEATASKEPMLAVHPGGELRSAEDLPTQTTLSEQPVKSKQTPQDVCVEPVESTVTQHNSEEAANADEVRKCIDVQNSTALKNEQLNSSVPAVSPPATSIIPHDKTDSVTPASVIPVTEVHISPALAKPETTPSIPVPATVTKTIKRAISVNKLSPEIANLIKSSIGKKVTKGTKPPSSGKAILDASKQAATLRTTSQVNQENQSTPLIVTVSDKPSSEKNVSGLSAGTRLPVLETRLENISPKETISSTKPPSPVKLSPVPTKQPDTGGPVTGVKKIQKVHQLTDEQRQLLLNSSRKSKIKRAVPVADTVKKDEMAVSHGVVESKPPNPPTYEPTVLPIAIGPPVPSLIGVPGDDCRINIISHIILPPISQVGMITQQNPLKENDGSVPVATASQCTSTAVSSPLSQQIMELAAGTGGSPAIASSNNANQYPKLFICHKPASSSYPPLFATSASPVKMNPPLVPPAVSVTVLPKTMQTNAQYPAFMNTVPARLPTCTLPEPVVTVRPTFEKYVPYGNTAPPPLPTPNITVTVSPVRSSPSLPIPMDVPVDPRIVPKIVIDGCDAVDHDSQSSLTSTSSSSSSGNNNSAAMPKQQSNAGSVKLAAEDRPDYGTGCSSDTLDKLRAKSLKNLRMKNESKMSGTLDTESSVTPVRQYGPAGRLNLQNRADPHSKITLQKIKECVSKKMQPISCKTIAMTSNLVTQCATDNHVQPNAPTVSDHVSEPAKTSEQPATNEFLGFSISSIERAERDFACRSRSIDLALEATRKSLEAARDSEEPLEELETSAATEESKRESTLPMPKAEVVEEIEGESVLNQNRTAASDPHTNCGTGTKLSSAQDEIEMDTIKIEPQVAPAQDEGDAIMHLPAPSKTALSDVTTVIISDSEDERLENTQENLIETVAKEMEASSNDKPNPQESVVGSDRSDGEDMVEILGDTASGNVSEAENSVEPNVETLAEEEYPAIPAPDLMDQTATGVDVIVAMAMFRRENRVMSLGDENDREEEGWMDEPIATPTTKPTSPSTSGRQLGSKKKRKRGRRKKRDEFMELLLKHVNYDTLIEDVVNQEKRRCNYVSSSDEEVRTISPLQRYIQEKEREQTRASAIVVADNDCSSPATLSEDEGSLIEETILKRVLNRLKLNGGESAETTPSNTTLLQVEESGECSSTPQNVIRSGDGKPDDQRDDVQRSIICDKAAAEAEVEIKHAQTSRGSMSDVEMVIADPMRPRIDDNVTQEHNQSCDTIETNAATCDTRAGAEEATREMKSTSPKVAETNNTHGTQVQVAGRTRRTAWKRVAVRKRPVKRLGKGISNRTIQQKRLKYSITSAVQMSRYDDSLDASNDDVVSDCSSDGLSTGEVVANSTIKTIPVCNTTEQCTDIGDDTAEGWNTVDGDVDLPGGEQTRRDTLNRSGRSRQGRRRHSSSSNSISSGTRPNSLSCDGDLSSSEDTKPGKRRKLRRKKRSTRVGGTNASTIATVDCTTDRSMSTTASSSTTNVSSQLPTASQHSKASHLDAQYVITEVAGESATAPPRVLDVINVCNNRVLSSGAPSQVPGQRRDRKRSAKSNQAANVDREEFINPNDTLDWQEQEQHAAVQSQSGTTELTDAVELENRLVKCANCGKEMLQSCWQEHYNQHNGATYRVDIDYPFDMKDVKAVAAAIGRFMKLQRRAEVKCERCGTVKKSGLGMASHMNSCGLSEQELEQAKTSCEHCGRKMKAVSLPIHQQQHCRVLKEQQRQIALSKTCVNEETTKETTASGRKKRKSVASAEQKIKTIAKEINEELYSELVLEICGRGVSNAIMQCWLSHLKQSCEVKCAFIDCPFFGMTSEHMRTEYNGDSLDPKPLYQCAKCAYMATDQKSIHEHLATAHPQTLRKIAERHRTSSNLANDSDALMASGDGSASTDDTYSSSALEESDEAGLGKSKKGKGKKQQTGASNKSKSKKNGECPGKGNSKKSAGKQTGANKAISSECLDTSTAGGGTEETEVYKEMVLQESIEYKQDKANYHLMTVKWTHEFRREHYTARLLFSELRPDMDTSYLRSVSNVKDYLPKVTHSMRYVQCNSAKYDPEYEPKSFANRWQQKNTFDGEALGCESMFYCGGPVVSLDWLPLPDDCGKECDQFLAVACKQTYDEYYHGEDLAVSHSRKKTKITLRCPRLAFAIACDYGPIWQVAFCPSGCYNDPAKGDDQDRLGLLAVAGSDGDVHLYALSRSMVGPENETPGTAPRVLHLRPVLLLSLSVTVGSETHPAADFTGRSVVRIAWTREKGHNVLAAGYSNGVVAVWNLAATSPLLCGTTNGIRTLLPVHKLLHSSSGCISALDLHYSSGSRYLVVCNADRRMKVYDLRCNLYQPQESLSMVMRSRISAVRWLLHFPVLVIAYDDALYIDRCAYSVHQPRDIGLRMFSIFTIGSETTDLGTNDWHSTNAVATSGGDLVCHRPVPFVFGMNYKKLAQILTTTIPVKINAIDDSADVSRYKAFSEEYGLIFSDTDKIPNAMDTAALHLKTWRRTKFNHYPAVRLNQIRWNPNSFSYTYYAIGYQAGFVRIRFWEEDVVSPSSPVEPSPIVPSSPCPSAPGSADGVVETAESAADDTEVSLFLPRRFFLCFFFSTSPVSFSSSTKL
uniref:C2H2-type domain-containing protein n=1 Tax=Anopheles minimus TaxID=112268 RepID=A0A182W975_9DIPT